MKMNQIKSTTQIQTKFITVWNNLLEAFNQVLFEIPGTEQLSLFILLINKINSNCRAAINLIEQGFINEGRIILRSAIETVIYAKYLKLYPEEQDKFLYLSDFFLIKNQFIQYKEIKNNRISTSPNIQILLQSIEDNIRQIFTTNQLLKQQLSSVTLEFDENSMRLLDKFFQTFSKKNKFPSQNIYDLLQKIKEKEPQFANTPFNLSSIYYTYYDENSAILHGNRRYWNEQPHLDEYHLGIISSHLLRILVVAADLIQEDIPQDVYNYFDQIAQDLKELELTEQSTPFPAH